MALVTLTANLKKLKVGSIVAVPLHFFLFSPTCRDFQLDKKEGQKREFLSQDVDWQIKTIQCFPKQVRDRPTRIPPTPAVLSGWCTGYVWQSLVSNSHGLIC
jgi:hypothetical protein